MGLLPRSISQQIRGLGLRSFPWPLIVSLDSPDLCVGGPGLDSPTCGKRALGGKSQMELPAPGEDGKSDTGMWLFPH